MASSLFMTSPSRSAYVARTQNSALEAHKSQGFTNKVAWASICTDSSVKFSPCPSLQSDTRKIAGRICGLIPDTDFGLDEADYDQVCYSPLFRSLWKPWLDSASISNLTPQAKFLQKRPHQSSSKTPPSMTPLHLAMEIGHFFYKSPLQGLNKTIFARKEVQETGLRKVGQSANTESDCCLELVDGSFPVCLAIGCAFWMKLSVADSRNAQIFFWEGIIYSDPIERSCDKFELRMRSQEPSERVLTLGFERGICPREQTRPKIVAARPEASESRCIRLMNLRIEASQMFENFRDYDSATRESPAFVRLVRSSPQQPEEQDNYRFNILVKKGVSLPVSGSLLEGPGNKYNNTIVKQLELPGSANKSVLIDVKAKRNALSVEFPAKNSEKKFSALFCILGNPKQLLMQATHRESCFILQNQAENLNPTTDKELTNALLETTLPNFKNLACNTYGNFLIQILLRKVDGQKIASIVERVPHLINTLSSDKVGVFTIQKIIAKLETNEQQQTFLTKLQQSSIIKLSMESLPTFMFKKVLSTFPGLDTASLLLQSLKSSFLTVASDKHGICVIKLMLSTLEETLRGYLSVLHEFLQHLEEGKHNSHFNFGIHHLLESAYSRGYLGPGVERLVQAYFSTSEGKLRLRSRAVLQTLLIMLEYPESGFRRDAILPALRKAFHRPPTSQELSLLNETAASQPETADRIKLIMSCFQTFAQY